MRKWYVVNTRSKEENLATSELLAQGFVVFCPKYLVQRTNKKTGMNDQTIHPLFPSYIFVRLDVAKDTHWPSINGTRGVVGLVGYTPPAYLAPVAKGCIEALLKRADKAGIVPLEQAVKQVMAFAAGMRVKIVEGQFAGQLATYCNQKENRILLLISLLGKQTVLILNPESVAVVPN